jgi:hypothetical protein
MSGLSGSLFCHYGETNYAFLIGGVVESNETLMTGAIRHCRRLVDLRLKPSQRLYSTKAINGLIDHEPVKISIFVIDILFNHLRWRARHHTPRLATITTDHLNDIEASYDGQPGPLPPVEIPTSLIFHTPYGTLDEFSIYSWDERTEKSRCFDFGDFLNVRDIENNLGTTTKSSLVFGVTFV